VVWPEDDVVWPLLEAWEAAGPLEEWVAAGPLVEWVAAGPLVAWVAAGPLVAWVAEAVVPPVVGEQQPHPPQVYHTVSPYLLLDHRGHKPPRLYHC